MARCCVPAQLSVPFQCQSNVPQLFNNSLISVYFYILMNLFSSCKIQENIYWCTLDIYWCTLNIYWCTLDNQQSIIAQLYVICIPYMFILDCTWLQHCCISLILISCSIVCEIYIKHLVYTLVTACYRSNIIVFQVVYSRLCLFDGIHVISNINLFDGIHVLSNINLMLYTSSTYVRF